LVAAATASPALVLASPRAGRRGDLLGNGRAFLKAVDLLVGDLLGQVAAATMALLAAAYPEESLMASS
jgi:hypothetical protein